MLFRSIPVLVAKAVPTDRAVQYANENKIVLIARARRDSFEVFSNKYKESIGVITC